MLSLSCTTCRCLPAVKGHGSGPAVPGPPLTEVLDQVQDWCGVLCEGQSEEVLLHSSGGPGCEYLCCVGSSCVKGRMSVMTLNLISVCYSVH